MIPPFTSIPANVVKTNKTQTLTNKTLDSPSFEGDITGWISADETWTYVSATTFTVSGDVTAKYPKGTKIKLTNSTVKYFYVVGTSYGAPNTTVTVTGGSDYALADAAITANYYSYMETPQGFPDWFNWTPTISVTSGGTAPDYTGSFVNRFKIVGSTVYFYFYWRNASGGTAGSGDGYILFTLPVAMAYYVDGYTPLGTGQVFEDSGTIIGALIIGEDSNTQAVFKSTASGLSKILGNDQSSTLRGMTGNCFYEI